MEYFIVQDGKVQELSKEEYESLHGIDVGEYVKDMTPSELEAFQKRRYENFVKPLMEFNVSELKKRK